MCVIFTSLRRDSYSYVRMCTEKLGIPDDMAVGAVIELLLGYNLTNVWEMQNHLEKQQHIKPEQLKNMVTRLPLTNL